MDVPHHLFVDRLATDLDTLDGSYPTKVQQREWIAPEGSHPI